MKEKNYFESDRLNFESKVQLDKLSIDSITIHFYDVEFFFSDFTSTQLY